MRLVTLIFISFSFLLLRANAVLFPSGLSEGDQFLNRDLDDGSSPEFHLSNPIFFFDHTYRSVYINQNGLVSFETEIPTFVNVQFPLDYPNISPFYSDVDTRIAGSIYYRETNNDQLLERANKLLKEHFSSTTEFSSKSLLIVTWDGVGYFNRKSDKTNTFQLVVASDEKDSYALFLYERIEWIQGDGKNPNLPDALAQAGFTTETGVFFTLPDSGSDRSIYLHKRSNLGKDGIWAFRIGKVGDKIEEPDLNVEIDSSSEATSSCSTSSCHSHAQCFDFHPGHCCKCQKGYYGNGKSCLQEGNPQRLSGKVKGVINGETIDDSDLFSYILSGDGRAYTAIANINEKIGYDMQTLSIIGVIIGWMFSVSVKGAPNGFQMTGGLFNYTAEVSFQTGQKILINQNYMGLDVFEHVIVNTRINGDTPVVPKAKTMEIKEYETLFSRVRPGILRSRSSHKYIIEDTSEENHFSIEQTIEYNECPFAPPVPPELETVKMKVERNYIIYDAVQQIVRYAVTSKVTPKEGEDPCKENRDKCGPNSSCVSDDDGYKCICDLGYEHKSDGYDNPDETTEPQCFDIDECQVGSSACDISAECTNTQGSYRCSCKEGLTGDGFTCIKEQPRNICQYVHCGQNGECIENDRRDPECRCLPGFYGDGLICLERTSEDILEGEAPNCRQLNICDPFASCIYSQSSESFICQCLPGYAGDGTVCTKDDGEGDFAPDAASAPCHNCHHNADCRYDEESETYGCVCRRGTIGNGFTCEQDFSLPPEPTCFVNYCMCKEKGFIYDPIRHECILSDSDIDTNPTCDSDQNCHENGFCTWDGDQKRCKCKDSYYGDGYSCMAIGESEKAALEEYGCDVLRNCPENSNCDWNYEKAKYTCKCNQGFKGDGSTYCHEDLTGCNVLKNCGSNELCIFDEGEYAFRCQCKENFVREHGLCISSLPCYHDPNTCDPHAECVPNEKSRKWQCQCLEGYIGNGYECSKIQTRDGSFLIVAKGMSLIKVSLEEEVTYDPLVVEPFQTAVGIDIDCISQKVYWSDVSRREIKSANFNGTEKMTFISDDIGSPEGLAVDWSSRNVYWTDSQKDTIEVANLVSSLRRTLIKTGLVNPRGIAVFSERGRLFWTDWDRSFPKIEYSGLDGQLREVLVSTDLTLPNSLTIDKERDEICWADAGTQKIECIGIDGRNRKTVVSNAKYPFGLSYGSNIFYWTDWETKRVETASRFNGELGKHIEVSLGGQSSKLYGLVFVPTTCVGYGNSHCANYSPCGEDRICIPNIKNGISCLCKNNADSSNCTDLY